MFLTDQKQKKRKKKLKKRKEKKTFNLTCFDHKRVITKGNSLSNNVQKVDPEKLHPGFTHAQVRFGISQVV